MRFTTQSVGAGTSLVILSVSMTTRFASWATLPPSSTSHSLISTSVMDSPKDGTVSSTTQPPG